MKWEGASNTQPDLPQCQDITLIHHNKFMEDMILWGDVGGEFWYGLSQH